MSGAGAARHGGGLVICAVGLAQIAVVLDYYSLNVALPTIARDFGMPATDLHWVLTAYLLAFAALLVAGGRLGDVLGRRRMTLAGIGLFGLGSLLCGLAPSEYALVGFRVVQGAGAALLFPVTMAVVSAAFPAARRAWAIGVVVGVANVGTAVGPFVGGALTGALGWRSVFLVNLPLLAVAAVLVAVAVSESRDADASRRIDWAGAGLLGVGLLAVMVAIDAANAWPLALVVALAGAGAALLTGFVWQERRAGPRVALLDLALIRRPAFHRMLGAGMSANFGWAASVLVATLALQEVRGFGPLEAGTVFLAMSAGAALAGPLAGSLTTRLGAERVMPGALALSAAGLVWLALAGPLWSYMLALFATGLGVSLAYGVASIQTLAAAPPEAAGSASGVTITAMVVVAALAVTCASILLEAIGGEDAVRDVLLVAAAVPAAGLVALLAVRRRPAATA